MRETSFSFSGAAPESNRPSVGLPRRTGFEGLQSQGGLATEAPKDHQAFGIEFGVAITDAT